MQEKSRNSSRKRFYYIRTSAVLPENTPLVKWLCEMCCRKTRLETEEKSNIHPWAACRNVWLISKVVVWLSHFVVLSSNGLLYSRNIQGIGFKNSRSLFWPVLFPSKFMLWVLTCNFCLSINMSQSVSIKKPRLDRYSYACATLKH